MNLESQGSSFMRETKPKPSPKNSLRNTVKFAYLLFQN